MLREINPFRSSPLPIYIASRVVAGTRTNHINGHSVNPPFDWWFALGIEPGVHLAPTLLVVSKTA